MLEWINNHYGLVIGVLQITGLFVTWLLKRDVNHVKLELNHRMEQWKHEAEELRIAAVEAALDKGRLEAAAAAAQLLHTAQEAAEIIKTTAAIEARKIVALAVEEAKSSKSRGED